MTSDETVFCINCGSEIFPDATFCPECGSGQDPESLDPEKQANTGERHEPTNHDGFTSWAIGFRPGETDRNILIGFAYVLFYVVGVPLLIYAYLRENPSKSKYFAWFGGGLLILMSVSALSVGTIWGIIVGGLSLLLGISFLPVVRQKLGLGGVPGIDVADSARRSVIVGSGYAIGSMALVGSALPETDADSSSPNGTAGEDGSTDGVSDPTGGSETSSGPEYAVRIVYSGAWQGAVSITGGGSSKSKSISGTGTETIGITGDVDIISVNAQKKDDSFSQLTVQILYNGDVVSESSTSAEYGVAQTGQSF